MSQALVFISDSLFSFFLMCLLGRIFLQIIGLHYSNQLAQFVSKITNPLVLPLRKVLPRVQQIDLAGWVLAYVIALLQVTCFFLIKSGGIPDPIGLVLFAIPSLIAAVINLFFYAIIIAMIASWIANSYNPVLEAIQRMVEPLLSPARRIIPPIAGFDLSPMLVLLVLQLLTMIVVSPLQRFAVGFM